MRARLILLATIVLVSGCGKSAHLPVQAGVGPNPQLPEPHREAIPTVQVAAVDRWADGEKPTAAAGLGVNAFAADLDHPRWLHVLPNGDVLVAETNGPKRPENEKGIKAKFMKHYYKKAGAATPSANRITLLRDADGDGRADLRQVFVSGLESPFGMALVGEDFYVANTNAIVRFHYTSGAAALEGKGEKLAALPGGDLNHHWTKSLIASRDGTKLYATVGSNSNVAEHGIDQEEYRACILEVDRASGKGRVFASGLRNPNGMGFEPATGMLWTAVNERDEIGGDIVPDYITSVRDGAFYGWPYSYYGAHVDERVQPPRPDLVAKAIAPDFAVGPHTASLGFTFYTASLLPEHYRGGAFVGQHGSWNRKPPSGYKVIYVPFADGKPSGGVEDVLTGFLDDAGQAHGRPVGVAVAKDGALLVADDVGNVIWRVAPKR
jgi:glucose/arabinose dehydrogenase